LAASLGYLIADIRLCISQERHVKICYNGYAQEKANVREKTYPQSQAKAVDKLRYAICETLRNVDFAMLLAIWKVRSHGFMQSG
jgi:hypothetical protein